MADILLLTADAADLALSILITPQWGVYLNGSPVIQPASALGQQIAAALAPVEAIASLIGAPNIVPVTASTAEFEYGQDRPISTFPQEQGAFQSYDKVTLPFDVKMTLVAGGSVANRQAFLSTCMSVNASFALFDIVTPEFTFPSCNCTRIGWRRNAKRGVSMISVDLWFEQVPVTATASFTNTQVPGISGQQSLGNVQPLTPNQQVQQGFDALPPM